MADFSIKEPRDVSRGSSQLKIFLKYNNRGKQY